MTASSPKKGLRSDLSLYATAIGYSALCFLPALIRLSNPELAYYRGSETLHRIFLPILLCQACVCILFLAVMFLLRRVSEPLRSIAVILLLFWPFDAAARGFVVSIGNTTIWQKGFVVLAVLAVLLLARSPVRLSRWLFSAVLFTLPGSLFLCSYAGYLSFHQETSHFQERTPRQSFHSKPSVRVIWIIFDELDPDVLITHRPPSLALPNFDRLLGSSLFSVQVRRSGLYTRNAIPALLTGEDVLDTELVAPDNLLLRPQNGEKRFFQNESTTFDDASALGLDSAIVGWYHPYGRLLGDRVHSVVWRSAEDFFGFDNQQSNGSLLQRARNQLVASFSDLLLVGKTPWANRAIRSTTAHMRRELDLVDAAQPLIGDESIGLLFLHLPIPHSPPIWNRESQKYELVGRSYVDSVVLADHVLGSFLQTLDRSGLADRTALLVTGDHGWRRTLWRAFPGWTKEDELTGGPEIPPYVPFLLRMPGQRKPLPYPSPFDATLSRKIVRGVLAGEFRSAEDISNWLGRQ